MANRMHDRSTTTFLTPIMSHPPIGLPSMPFLKLSKDNERATNHVVVVVVVETIDSGCTHASVFPARSISASFRCEEIKA